LTLDQASLSIPSCPAQHRHLPSSWGSLAGGWTPCGSDCGALWPPDNPEKRHQATSTLQNHGRSGSHKADIDFETNMWSWAVREIEAQLFLFFVTTPTPRNGRRVCWWRTRRDGVSTAGSPVARQTNPERQSQMRLSRCYPPLPSASQRVLTRRSSSSVSISCVKSQSCSFHLSHVHREPTSSPQVDDRACCLPMMAESPNLGHDGAPSATTADPTSVGVGCA
jgi:hypothetical protein